MSLDSPQALCRVRLVPSNNYFIRLAGSLPNLSVTVSDVPVVQLVLSANSGVSLYCTVLGRISEGGSEVVECGTKMGLADRQTVVVRRPPESVLGLATQVVVAPDTIGDWQILQLNQAGWSTSMVPIIGPFSIWKPTILMPQRTNEEQELPLVCSRGYFCDKLVLYGIILLALAWQP